MNFMMLVRDLEPEILMISIESNYSLGLYLT